MKTYQLKFSFSLTDSPESYAPPYQIQCEIKERLPANIDAEKYLRSRFAEEIKRQFSSLLEPIDNKTEEAQEQEDPLAF
jgi:hypothetical protein